MSKKASELVQYYHNPNGPTIGTVHRGIIQQDGLYFKDLDGSGEFKPYDDWRLSPAERAAAYVKALSTDEKIGQLFISDWRMGLVQEDKTKLDPSGLLDEGNFDRVNIFGEQHLPGTSVMLKEWWGRHLILRTNPQPDELADWLDQLQAVAEECEHFVPVQVVSNSRNEHGEVIFGMNDASDVFATWPGTLGIAAAVRGNDIRIVDDFADCIRREWNATGLRKGYMYMADTVTDPRWQRTYGTFGEDPQLIAEIVEHLVPRIQGSAEGVTADGVAMTIKHFPGGGARENGFDPHYKAGQWNVYATESSLEQYHLPGFRAAVEQKVSSIMPYYAKPAIDKSVDQGVPMEPYGFAYNAPFITDLLREQMGFEGYVNSDTGIVHNMCWGVEHLDQPERIAFALSAGTDLISGMFDIESGKEAYARAQNGYYNEKPTPGGIPAERLTLDDAALDRAVTRTLTELFALGMFENPYRDPQEAVKVVATPSDWANAADAHRKSVVLLKNDGVLPLTTDKLAGKTVYAECFAQKPEAAATATQKLRETLAGRVTLTDDPAAADYAILFLTPSSGAYFSATSGYLELELCEDKVVPNVDELCRPTAETHTETTLSGVGRIAEIAQAVHTRGGKVIANLNITLAWEVGPVEPLCDALLAGFHTHTAATLDVLFGDCAPTGKLPLTLPRNDSVLAVDADGVCISPNDVPGYAKDAYLPDYLKDENGKAYAYRDTAGNYYELDFGLGY